MSVKEHWAYLLVELDDSEEHPNMNHDVHEYMLLHSLDPKEMVDQLQQWGQFGQLKDAIQFVRVLASHLVGKDAVAWVVREYLVEDEAAFKGKERGSTNRRY